MKASITLLAILLLISFTYYVQPSYGDVDPSDLSIEFSMSPSTAVADRNTYFNIAVRNTASNILEDNFRFRVEIIDSEGSYIFTTGGLAETDSATVEYIFGEAGTYTVNVTIFSIGSQIFDAPIWSDFTVEVVAEASGTLTITLLDVATLDSYGQATSNFRQGQTVLISASLVNNDEVRRTFLFIVQIKDSSQHILSLNFILGSIAPGQKLAPGTGISFQQTGEYVAEIYIWESFRSGKPLAPHASVSFTVG